MLFCPGFGDQLATAAKVRVCCCERALSATTESMLGTWQAERLGLGLKVDRPPKQEQASSEVGLSLLLMHCLFGGQSLIQRMMVHRDLS